MATPNVLLDTTIVIDFLRKTNKQNSIFMQLLDQYQFYISVITQFETEIGLKSPQHQTEYQDLLARVVVLSIDSPCIEQAVEIHKYLKLNNALIGMADLLIGATALCYQLPVVTLNYKHFSLIPHLTLIDLPS